MPQFPLYDTLISTVPNKDLTVLQKKEMIKRIPALDQDAHELLYALIKSFYIEHQSNHSVNLELPFNASLQKNKIVFNLLELPNKLRQLLYKFITIHNKKLQEDQLIHAQADANNK